MRLLPDGTDAEDREAGKHQGEAKMKSADAEGKILVSACLAGRHCRYDGKEKEIPEIARLVAEGRMIPVCPESAGGLMIPREPSEIRGDRVFSKSGKEVTAEYQEGARRCLKVCQMHHCGMAVLKSKSPSCGKGCIHNGKFDGGLVEGNGVFAQMCLDHGIEVLTEDEFLADPAVFMDGTDGR